MMPRKESLYLLRTSEKYSESVCLLMMKQGGKFLWCASRIGLFLAASLIFTASLPEDNGKI